MPAKTTKPTKVRSIGRKAKGSHPVERLKPQEVRGLMEQARRAVVQGSIVAIKRLTEEADDGHIGAAAILLDKVIPTLQAQVLPIDLEERFEEGGYNLSEMSLCEKADALITMTMQGAISPSTAMVMMNAMKAAMELQEMETIQERLDTLERLAKARPVN